MSSDRGVLASLQPGQENSSIYERAEDCLEEWKRCDVTYCTHETATVIKGEVSKFLNTVNSGLLVFGLTAGKTEQIITINEINL